MVSGGGAWGESRDAWGGGLGASRNSRGHCCKDPPPFKNVHIARTIRSRIAGRADQSATRREQSARVLQAAQTNPPRAANNPLAYCGPRRPIRHAQRTIRWRIGGTRRPIRHAGEQSAGVLRAAETNLAQKACLPRNLLQNIYKIIVKI